MKSNWQLGCIFCRRVGSSTSEEHILPESGGNTVWVLPPGVVCDPCNNYFASELDVQFLNAPGVDVMRPFAVPATKSGRPPRSEFLNAELRGARKNERMRLSLGYQTKEELEAAHQSMLNAKRDPDTGKYLLKVTLEKRYDRKTRNQVSRFLLKAGLEYLALSAIEGDLPASYVMGSQFDWARRWVRSPPNKKRILPHATISDTPAPYIGLGVQVFNGIATVMVAMYGTFFIMALQEVSLAYYDDLRDHGFWVVQNASSGPLGAN